MTYFFYEWNPRWKMASAFWKEALQVQNYIFSSASSFSALNYVNLQSSTW